MTNETKKLLDSSKNLKPKKVSSQDLDQLNFPIIKNQEQFNQIMNQIIFEEHSKNRKTLIDQIGFAADHIPGVVKAYYSSKEFNSKFSALNKFAQSKPEITGFEYPKLDYLFSNDKVVWISDDQYIKQLKEFDLINSKLEGYLDLHDIEKTEEINLKIQKFVDLRERLLIGLLTWQNQNLKYLSNNTDEQFKNHIEDQSNNINKNFLDYGSYIGYGSYIKTELIDVEKLRKDLNSTDSLIKEESVRSFDYQKFQEFLEEGNLTKESINEFFKSEFFNPSEKNPNQAVCSTLEIKNEAGQLKAAGQDLLKVLFQTQIELQELYGHNLSDIQRNVYSLKEYFDWNAEALRDEISETRNALAGIHKYPNGESWKPWKSLHSVALSRAFSDFSNAEILELQMEVIDQLKFVFNQAWMVGLTPELITNLYFAKNRENITRLKTGY